MPLGNLMNPGHEMPLGNLMNPGHEVYLFDGGLM